MMLLAVVSLSFVACQTDDPAPAPTPKADFEVEVTGVTRASVTFNVTPADPSMHYLCAVYDVATVESFSMDQYLISTLYQEIGEIAASKGQTMAEYMPTILDQGAITDVTFSGLAIESDYYVIIFGVDVNSANFRPTTAITKVPFTTDTVEMIDCSFDVTPTVNGRDVSISVVPSDKETHWHLFLVTKAMYNQNCHDSNGPKMSDASFFQQYFNQEIQTLLGQGYTADQIIEMIIPTGDKTLGASGMLPDTEYTWLVAGIGMDEEGVWINSLVYKGSFKSGELEKVDLTFDISVTDVTDTRASLKIVPSTSDATFCWRVLEYDGTSSAEELMNRVVEAESYYLDYGYGLSKGVQDYTGNGSSTKYRLDAPDTDYCVLAFGYDGGVTSEPSMTTFRTLPAPEDVNFTMTVSNITPYTASVNISTSSEAVYYTAGVMNGTDFDEAMFIEENNAAFDEYYREMEKANPGLTIAEFLRMLYWRGNQQLSATDLLPNTEYMGYIVAFDIKTGHIAKVYTFPSVMTTIPLGNATPEIKLLGYFSGDEENGSVFDDPSATAGRAILLVEYTNLENARSLFTYTIEQNISVPSAEYSDSYLYAATSWINIEEFKTQPYGYFVIPWVTNATVLAYTNDKSGVPGAIARLLVKATAEEKSPIEDLIEHVNSLEKSARESMLVLPESVVIAETSEVVVPQAVIEFEAPEAETPAVVAAEPTVATGFVMLNEISTLHLRR